MGAVAGVVRPERSRSLEVSVGKRTAWLESADPKDLESPPGAKGVRLIPPGDAYLQAPKRALLTPEAALRRRLFRPFPSPGVVVKDGRLAGLWRVKARGKKDEIAIEKLRRLSRRDVEEEAGRIAELRGVGELVLVLY